MVPLFPLLGLVAAAAATCRDSDIRYCARFTSAECQDFSLHDRCERMCGACTDEPTQQPTFSSPTVSPSVPLPAGIIRSGSNLVITSATGGNISLNGIAINLNGRDVVRGLLMCPGPQERH